MNLIVMNHALIIAKSVSKVKTKDLDLFGIIGA